MAYDFDSRFRAGDLVDVAVPVPLRRNFTYRLPAGAEAVRIGDVVQIVFHGRRRMGVVVGPGDDTGLDRVLDVQEVIGGPYRLGPVDFALAERLAAHYACGLGEVLRLFLPPRSDARARKDPLAVGAGASPEEPPELNPEQALCVERVGEALAAERYESFLLWGITGSGKTEVYLRLAERCLAAGRGVLVLLPEIALTPQTIRRLRRRFPGRVAPYHSRLTIGERRRSWEAAATGEARILVGPRGAALVPVHRLGLIIVDEEHDPSFKGDERPRVHARDVALLRGALSSVPVVLGSATPSLESFHNARTGKHHLLELSARAGISGGLPEVRIVDRRDRGDGGYEPISPALAEAIRETLSRGEQAIVYHNRRGFARYLQCPACGNVIECPRCDISLTYHLGQDRLRCHYCDHSRRRPDDCPSCGAPVLDPRGVGTQRVELALESWFPDARILRLDQDSTRRRQAHGDLLGRFRRREADILLGTQMVAKGLDFPGVTLVGVIDADQGLHFPDFRAHERAFQLLTQVAGRSGRRHPGVVIVQTRDPEHRVLVRVKEHDVLGFLEEEAQQRRVLGYPPFRRLTAVGASAPDAERLDRVLDRLAASLRRHLPPERIEVLGPARAVLARINRRHRGQLLIKGSLLAAEKQWILDLFEHVRRGEPRMSQVELVLDVDPVHLL